MLRGTFARDIALGSQEPLFAVSPTGRVLDWTRLAEILLGHSRADVLGRSLLALLVLPEEVEDVQSALATAVTDGQASAWVRLRTRSGSTLDEPLPLRLARGEDGITFLVGREPTPPALPPAGAVADASDTVLRIEAGPAKPSTGRGSPHASPFPEAAARALVDVHRALATGSEARLIAQRAARVLVPALCDWCAFDLVTPAGPLERAAVAHSDAALEAAVYDIAPGDEEADGPADAARVLRTGVAALERAAAEAQPTTDMPRRAQLRRVGLSSCLLLPLSARLRPLGVLTLALAPGEREYRAEDLAWAEDLARRIALEVENARLADTVQRARWDVRRATERASLLQDLAAAVSEALTPREVTNIVIEQGRLALRAAGGAVAVLREKGFDIIGSAGPADALANAWKHFPVHARYPLSDAGRSGELVLLESVAQAVPLYPHLASAPPGVGAMAAVPLVVDGRRTGALGLVFAERREFSEADVAFMRTLARVCADALERARLYDAERSARARASEEASRSSLLAEASRLLASSFDTDATLRGVARLMVPAIADWCAIVLAQPDGTMRTLTLVHAEVSKAALALECERLPPSPASATVAKVLETHQPEIYENVPDEMLPSFATDPRLLSRLRALGLRSQMVVPLHSHGKALGAVVLTHGGVRRFAPADLRLAEELARRIAMAIDNARLFRAAHESEERARLLVEGAQDHAFFMLDAQGRIAGWNAGAERIHGFAEHEAVGEPLSLLYPPSSDLEQRLAEHLRIAREHGRFEEDGWRRRRDGTFFLANVVVTALPNADGSLRGFAHILRDLTERQRAREALDLARQQIAANEKLASMGTLVSGVAHEIRTPLTAISNGLHLIDLRLERLRGATVDDAAHEAMRARLHDALSGVDRINALVDDLRRFHRLPVSERGRFGLHEVVREALNLYRAAHRGRIEVAESLEATSRVPLDRIQVQQAVLNLLQNAAEAMPHGGSVRLLTRQSGPEALLVVEDDGAGMTDEVKARMYEEFFTTKPEGTGLGLSIVRRIIEAHDARIECESAPGRGTRFTLRFAVPGGPDATH